MRIALQTFVVLALAGTLSTDLFGQPPPVLEAIVDKLESMQSHYAGTHGLLIREGLWGLSRHDVKHSFRTPQREWSPNEKQQLLAAATRSDVPLHFCRDNCKTEPHTEWTVAIGLPTRVTANEMLIPVQLDAIDENMTWNVVYEMVVVRSPDDTWTVTEARPGASSDAVPCEELYGHSCEEEFGPSD